MVDETPRNEVSSLRISQLVLRPDGLNNLYQWADEYGIAMKREYEDFGQFSETRKLEEATLPRSLA